MSFEKWWAGYCDEPGLFDEPIIEARKAWNAALDAVSRHAGTQLRLHDVDALRAVNPKGNDK